MHVQSYTLNEIARAGYYCCLTHCPACSGLRMLRVAQRLKGVRVVVVALRKLLPDLMNVLLVGLLFYYIFSVSARYIQTAAHCFI